jgi:hypothetical protein
LARLACLSALYVVFWNTRGKMQQIYKTTDGTEFSSQEDAIAHENVTEAYKGYKDAVEKLQCAIGSKLITADGYPFIIGGHTNYYYIVNPFTMNPTVVDIVVSFHNFEIDKYNHSKIRSEYYDGNKMIEIWCDIDSIYKSCPNAYEKLIKLWEEKQINIDEAIKVFRSNYL